MKKLLSKIINKIKSIIKLIISSIGTLDIILIIVMLLFIYFNKQMIDLYKMYGTMPESYAIAIVAALLGECGICGRIFSNKLKHKEREMKYQFMKDHPDYKDIMKDDEKNDEDTNETNNQSDENEDGGLG